MNSNAILDMLKELNQEEVISKYNLATQEEKDEFEKQINLFEKSYPGGLREYIKKAKKLLNDSLLDKNPLEGYIPSIPEGIDIKVEDEKYFELEKLGFDEIKDTCFTLVAGGLGERLGYYDVKIGIETDLISKRKIIEVYTSYILEYEKRLRQKFQLPEEWFIPFCIMTSGVTHEKTIKLLKDYNYFGLKKEQVDIVKQELCPALLDNECHLSLQKDKLLLEEKPHGHGDVHMLLYQHKIIEKWLSLGKKWFLLIQDTNVLTFNAVPAALATSKKLDLIVNLISVKKKPGETLGGVCNLTNDKGEKKTLTIEYNQFDRLLISTVNSKGDEPDEEGYSKYPGSINIIAIKLEPYFKVLEKTQGLMPEFVNPKYVDKSKTKFKSATRLECLMQDFPKLLTPDQKVGYCMFEKWFIFSTIKNELKEGCAKIAKGTQQETALSCEQDIFKTNIRILKDVLGVLKIDESEPEFEMEIEGYKIRFGPKIIIYPSFACTIQELKDKIKGKITMGNRSTLILKGNCSIQKDVYLDGVLTIDKDVTQEIQCMNKKRNVYVPLKPGEGESFERIRGYKVIDV